MSQMLFQGAGLYSPEGTIHFDSLILNLMDLNKSLTINHLDFVTFVMVSKAMEVIQKKISKFFTLLMSMAMV
jgi:hypothetical protein